MIINIWKHTNVFRTTLREKVRWGRHYEHNDVEMCFHMRTGSTRCDKKSYVAWGSSDLFYFKCSLINVSQRVGKNMRTGPPGSSWPSSCFLTLLSWPPTARGSLSPPSELLSPADPGVTITSSERSPGSPHLRASLWPLITARPFLAPLSPQLGVTLEFGK